MRPFRYISSILILLFLTITFTNHVRGEDSHSTMLSNITWTHTTIDSADNVGQHASLSINPVTDLPHVSYYDATASNLRHAYLTNNPINNHCLTAGWECEGWNTPDNDGIFSAVAVRNNGNYGILYYNSDTYSVYFRGDQGDGNPFTNQLIDGSALKSNNLQYNRYGVPHVVYKSGGGNADTLRYAKYVASGGNCGNSAWQCEIIYSNSSPSPITVESSLGLSYYGAPYLAFGNQNGLYYGRRVPGNGICGPSWTCSQIESNILVTAVALFQPSCQFICLDPVQIGYYDITNRRLKLATSVGSGGNCGVDDQAGKWQCDTIETMGGNGQFGVSMAVYNGQPYIAYTDGDDRSNTTLKTAYPSPGGNCGPILNGAGTWQCDTVDSGLRFSGGFPFYRNVGFFPSIGISSDGTLYTAYYDGSARDLLVAVGQSDAPPPPPPPTADFEIYLPAVIN